MIISTSNYTNIHSLFSSTYNLPTMYLFIQTLYKLHEKLPK